jgi:hypothetical protein
LRRVVQAAAIGENHLDIVIGARGETMSAKAAGRAAGGTDGEASRPGQRTFAVQRAIERSAGAGRNRL